MKALTITTMAHKHKPVATCRAEADYTSQFTHVIDDEVCSNASTTSTLSVHLVKVLIAFAGWHHSELMLGICCIKTRGSMSRVSCCSISKHQH